MMIVHAVRVKSIKTVVEDSINKEGGNMIDVLTLLF